MSLWQSVGLGRGRESDRRERRKQRKGKGRRAARGSEEAERRLGQERGTNSPELGGTPHHVLLFAVTLTQTNL